MAGLATSVQHATSAVSIRPARVADAAAMLAIYAPYVLHTAVSFELTPPTLDEFSARIRTCSDGWAWLVAERGGTLLGYVYASAHRERAAYRGSVETSAYVAPAAQRQGIAARLYPALFAAPVEKGYHNAYAGIALPNEASVGLHRSVGFQPIGVFPSVGRKFDAWHDVGWFHRPLIPG